MDVAQGVDMRKDTVFCIASMTKPLTSVAVMMLVERLQPVASTEYSKPYPLGTGEDV
jgi:hypothetical protein